MKEAYLRSVGALLDCPAEERKRLLEECDPAAVADIRRRKTRRHRILIAALAALLALAVGVAAYLWSSGGLVMIEIRENAARPTGQVYYDYDS